MNKRDIIDLYFESFRAKDIKILKSIFKHDGFGVRTFIGNLLFSFEDIEKIFLTYTVNDVLIKDFEELNDVVYVKATMKYTKDSIVKSENIIVKFVFLKNLLIRAFETVEKEGYSRIMCVVSYDGSTFSGFQRQPGLSTVQGEIEKGLWFMTKEKVTVHSSGRTDKGVHAINQTFHFDTRSKIDPNNFGRVLNSYLPDSIHITSSKVVHNTFHCRYDAFSKEYVYKINIGEYDPIQRNYEWHVDGVNVEILKREVMSIIGIHNFTSFTKTKEDKRMIREIFDVKVEEKGSYIYISIIGSGFLRYMVRYIIGASVEIAKGNVDDTLLNFIGYLDSSTVKWKAPSSGLYLKEVRYF